MDLVETIETLLSEDEIQAALQKIRENCNIIVNSCRKHKAVSVSDNLTDAHSVLKESVSDININSSKKDESGYESHTEKASHQNIDEIGDKDFHAPRLIVDAVIQDVIDGISNPLGANSPLKRITLKDPKARNNGFDNTEDFENVLLNPLWISSEEDLCPPGEEDYNLSLMKISDSIEHKIRIRKDLMPSFDFDSTNEKSDTKDNSDGYDELEEGEYIEDFNTSEDHGLQLIEDSISKILVDDNSNITNIKKEDMIDNAKPNHHSKIKSDQMMIDTADLNLGDTDNDSGINSSNNIRSRSSTTFILAASKHDFFKEDLDVEDEESLKGVVVAPINKKSASERKASKYTDTNKLLALGGWISPISNDRRLVSLASLTDMRNKDTNENLDEMDDDAIDVLRSAAVASLRNVTNQELPTVKFQHRSSTPINKTVEKKVKDSYGCHGSKRSSSRSMERERCSKQNRTADWKKVSSFNSKDSSSSNYSCHSSTNKNVKKSKSKKEGYRGSHLSHVHNKESLISHRTSYSVSQASHSSSPVSQYGSHGAYQLPQIKSQYESQYESRVSHALSPISSRISARPSTESSENLYKGKVQSRLSPPKPSVFHRLGPPTK